MSADLNRVGMVVGASTYRMDSSADAYKALLVSRRNMNPFVQICHLNMIFNGGQFHQVI